MGVFDFDGVAMREAPEGAVPECPKCGAQLDRVWTVSKGAGFWGKETILMCPHCKVLLGFSTYRR
ncbi:MAG: hypothetical protein GY851_13025 [bacterium]|nr:hypothetical protein [bacterium]